MRAIGAGNTPLDRLRRPELRFRILGLLDVRTGSGPVAISGRHHPKLLAMLLEEANRVVPVERLVAGLWDDHPPSTADRQVQNIAAALRRQLGPAGERLHKVGSGYRMDLEEDELDLLRCRSAVAAASEHRKAGLLEEAERALVTALSEWSGPSLAGLSGTAIENAARRLEHYRIGLTEQRFDLGLRLGRHERLLGELRRLHLDHPHRQRFTEMLMTALYRSGRGPEALGVYAEARDRLAESMGVDPGKPLRDLHTAILREDPALDIEEDDGPSECVPVTLPSSTAAFTGRTQALALLDEADDSPAHPIVVLTGAGGVGKTMLALHWGHRAGERFPGGRLYLDMRGFDPIRPDVGPAEAARLLLGSMGVEPRRIPADPDAQIAFFRSVVGAERRLLVLDNVRDPDQIRPLLPDSSKVHTVVISRRQLVGLAASHGARVIEVGSFSRDEAVDLLERQIETRRLRAEPEALDRVLAACAGLPLALAITAARAATRPDQELTDIADELETSRLDALAGDEASVDLRAVFSWSYTSLEADAARLFRLLGLVPGPDFGPECAAALHGGPREAAVRALRQLVETHLVEPGRPGRYRLHDLVRIYAAELAESDEPEEGRVAASERMLEWYLRGADAARSLLYPEEAVLPAEDPTHDNGAANVSEAAEYMGTEWSNLVAAVEFAHERRLYRYAWRLADALRGYVWLGMHGSDGLRIGTAALKAATTANDRLGLASAELTMAFASIRSYRLREAMSHARRAADLARRSGWTAGVGSAEFNLAACGFYLGRMRFGIEHARKALRANREIGARQAECTSLHWMGIMHSLLGELNTGVTFFERAQAIAEEIGADSVKAVHLTHQSEVELFRGRLDAAATLLDEVASLESTGLGYNRMCDLEGATARLRLATGRVEEAMKLAQWVVRERTAAADYRIRSHAMVTLGECLDALGDHEKAIAQFDRVLAMTKDDATVIHRVQAQVGRARTVLNGGDDEQAEQDALRALRAARDAEYRFVEAQALNLLAEIDLKRRRTRRAAEMAERALRICVETGHRPGEAESLRLLARTALAEGDADAAGRHRDRSRALYLDMGAPIPADLA